EAEFVSAELRSRFDRAGVAPAEYQIPVFDFRIAVHLPAEGRLGVEEEDPTFLDLSFCQGVRFIPVDERERRTTEERQKHEPSPLINSPGLSGNRALQVGTQISDIFDADAQADQAVIDAARGAHFNGNAGMRHGRWVTDQRLDAPETLSEAEEPRSRHEALRRLCAAFQANRDHTAEVTH